MSETNPPADAGSAPASEQPNSSPMTGSESPAPAEQAGAAPAPSETPAAPTVDSAPTPQPPLPGVGVFEEHGKPAEANQPKAKKGVYVDAEGTRYDVEIVAERKDGSVDIMLPAVIGGYRRDGIRRRESEEQTGDYIELK